MNAIITQKAKKEDYTPITIPKNIKKRIEREGKVCRAKIQAAHVALYAHRRKLTDYDPEPNPTGHTSLGCISFMPQSASSIP